MKTTELLSRIWSRSSPYGGVDLEIARGAFLENLAAQLDLKRIVADWFVTPCEIGAFYSGMIAASKKSVSEKAIRMAHEGLMMPANRAIVSRLLYGPGPVQVHSNGLPVERPVEAPVKAPAKT